MKNNVRLLRHIRGVSQAELAKEAGFSRPKLSLIENGLVPISNQDKEKLASALGVAPEWLFPPEEERNE